MMPSQGKKKRPGLSIWAALLEKPGPARLSLLAYMEQRARPESDLEMLRAIKDCRAMLEAGELPFPDEAAEEDPPRLA